MTDEQRTEYRSRLKLLNMCLDDRYIEEIREALKEVDEYRKEAKIENDLQSDLDYIRRTYTYFS